MFPFDMFMFPVYSLSFILWFEACSSTYVTKLCVFMLVYKERFTVILIIVYCLNNLIGLASGICNWLAKCMNISLVKSWIELCFVGFGLRLLGSKFSIFCCNFKAWMLFVSKGGFAYCSFAMLLTEYISFWSDYVNHCSFGQILFKYLSVEMITKLK